MSNKSSSFLFFYLSCLVLASVVSAFEFRVGGREGWIMPANDDKEAYNDWAKQNRFHVGDSVNFKYKNDSVLVVSREDYNKCNTSEPVVRFEDGDTTFTFYRYGFFYFISGEPGHCEAGQKLIVRVMVHPNTQPTSPAPQSLAWAPANAPSMAPDSTPSSSSNHGMKNIGGLVATLGALALYFLFV